MVPGRHRPQLPVDAPLHFPRPRRSHFYLCVSDDHRRASQLSRPTLPGASPERRCAMIGVGQVLFAFFEDHLKTQKGLRPGSVRSYRDTMKLFLAYVAASCRRPITRLSLADLSALRVRDFLSTVESTRGNRVSTRNQRLAALHTFYRFLALRHPEMLAEAQQVEAIPVKRTAPPHTLFLEHDEIETLFRTLPRDGILALRDRALFMVLYNTGARAQEVADLKVEDVDLDGPLRVRLHGKGDKWRSCPLWPETAELLKRLTADARGNKSVPLFMSRQREPLTRFGITIIPTIDSSRLDKETI